MKKIFVILSYMVSAVFLYLSLYSIDYNILMQSIIKIDYQLILLASSAYILSFFIRGFRTLILLDYHTTYFVAVSSNFISYFLNNFIPLKGGDIYKIFFLNKKANIRKSQSAAIMIIERIFDLFSVLLIFFLSYLYFTGFSINEDKLYNILYLLISIIIILSIFIYFLIRMKKSSLLKKITFINHDSIDIFIKNLSIVINRKKTLQTLLVSILIWLSESFVFFIILDFHSMQIALIWMSTLALSFIIPNAPGNIGIFEWISIYVLTVFFMFPQEHALALSVLIHSIQFFSISIVGLILFKKYNLFHYPKK